MLQVSIKGNPWNRGASRNGHKVVASSTPNCQGKTSYQNYQLRGHLIDGNASQRNYIHTQYHGKYF